MKWTKLTVPSVVAGVTTNEDVYVYCDSTGKVLSKVKLSALGTYTAQISGGQVEYVDLATAQAAVVAAFPA